MEVEGERPKKPIEGNCQDIASASTPDITSSNVRTRRQSDMSLRYVTKTVLRRTGSATGICRMNGSVQQFSVDPVVSQRTSHSYFHTYVSRQTDGVFRELTSMRVRTPWIEALRQQQTESIGSAPPSGEPEMAGVRVNEPKHMDDSYHAVVLPLARDPWLLDTYLNSSGHIRLGTIFMDLDALSGIIA